MISQLLFVICFLYDEYEYKKVIKQSYAYSEIP